MIELRLIDWYEGMVIKQQNLQQGFLAVSNQISYLCKNIAPYMYGILDIELTTVGDGTFYLKYAKCIMPDYSVIYFKGEYPVSFNSKEENFDIYLCISDEYSVLKNGRFVSQSTEPIKDMHDPESRIIVSRLSLAPFLSASPMGTCMRIARYASWGSKKLIYDPPAPCFKKCDDTYARFIKIIEHMQSLVDTAWLKQQEHRKREDMNEYGLSLAKCLLTIQSTYGNNGADPFSIYSTLINSLTHIIDILGEDLPKMDLKYDHNDIYKSFEPIFDYIENKLTKISREYTKGVGRLKMINLGHELAENREALMCMVNGAKVNLLFYFIQGAKYEAQISTIVICLHSEIKDVLFKKTCGLSRKVIKMTELVNEILVEVEVTFPFQNNDIELIIIPATKEITKIYLN